MKKTRFPKGWNEKKVQRVLRHYEGQTETQAAREDDETFATRRNTVMRIPLRLVPTVRRMIARTA